MENRRERMLVVESEACQAFEIMSVISFHEWGPPKTKSTKHSASLNLSRGTPEVCVEQGAMQRLLSLQFIVLVAGKDPQHELLVLPGE